MIELTEKVMILKDWEQNLNFMLVDGSFVK